MSWPEPQGNGFAVKVAISDGSDWSTQQTVIEWDDLFVNWADFPSPIALSDGSLVAHWRQINGGATYQYDVKIARSDDEGKTWSKPFIPHDDRSQREHRFVTLLPTQNNEFMAIWFDGRNYDLCIAQDGVCRSAGRDLDCQYKTAFVLSHKLREAMAQEVHTGEVLDDHVEIDGAYFGGHIRPANQKKDCKDRRLKRHQTGKRRVVVGAMRERPGPHCLSSQ